MKLTLIPREGEDTGTFGLALKNMPETFDPAYEGLSIAHDLMEHFDHDGSLRSEFMAFGNLLWGRWEGGFRFLGGSTYAMSLESFGDWVGYDISRMLEQWIDDEAGELHPLAENKRWSRFYAENVGGLEGCTVEALDSLVSATRKAFQQDMKDREPFTFPSGELEQALLEMRKWVTVGYLRAARRADALNYTAEEVSWLFQQAVDVFDRLLKDADKLDLEYDPTIRAVVRWDMREREITATLTNDVMRMEDAAKTYQVCG